MNLSIMSPIFDDADNISWKRTRSCVVEYLDDPDRSSECEKLASELLRRVSYDMKKCDTFRMAFICIISKYSDEFSKGELPFSPEGKCVEIFCIHVCEYR